MLDHLKVDVYGDRMSLKSIGSVSVRDNQMLVVSAFVPQVRLYALRHAIGSLDYLSLLQNAHGQTPAVLLQTLQNIEKAIRESPLQLNPKLEGQEVLVPVPR
jgi:ribosome recycling factor